LLEFFEQVKENKVGLDEIEQRLEFDINRNKELVEESQNLILKISQEIQDSTFSYPNEE
jgi:hypothetical protein